MRVEVMLAELLVTPNQGEPAEQSAQAPDMSALLMLIAPIGNR